MTVDFGHGRTVTLWTLEIPKSLEHQISLVLKSEHSGLRSASSNVIEVASCMLGCGVEEVIRQSVRLLKDKRWFDNFCRKLQENLSIDS